MFVEKFDPQVVDRSVMENYGLRVCYGFNPDKIRSGGVTIVYRKTEDFKNTRMVEVSLAYCNPCDSFCKKTGLNIALQRWIDGQTVVIPARDCFGDTSISHNLVKMFYWNLYA